MERRCDDAHRSILYFDAVGSPAPKTLVELLAWKATREAWQLLLAIFHGVKESVNADWVAGNVGFDIPLALEDVCGFLKDAPDIAVTLDGTPAAA